MNNKILLKIAKEAIEEELYGSRLDRDYYIKNYPSLQEKRATFVTINERGSLRGCIGSLVAYRSLIDDLIENAKSAAFKDPRFPPLTKEEYENSKLDIEISLLTQPKELKYSDIKDLKRKIRVGVDGVVLSIKGYRATFLPQVWEQLPTFELFFSHLCQKAGLISNCLDYHPRIEVYQVEKIKDE